MKQIGLTFLISAKTAASSVPTLISLNNDDTTNNPDDIANTFFSSIAETMKQSMKYSYKPFSDYLANESGSTIIFQPSDKEELAHITTSLNSYKAISSKK